MALPEAAACLVYLPADHPRLEPLLAGLVQLSMPGIAYVRDATPQIIDWLRATPLEIATHPLDLGALLPGISVVLHQGGIGLSQHCLAFGRPQVIAPVYLEQELNCTAMQELGVAMRLGAALDPASSGPALERTARSPKLRRMAQRQAHAMQARYPHGSLAAVVKTCLARLQPHSFRPPAPAAEPAPDPLPAPGPACEMTVFFAADVAFMPVLEIALFSLLQHNRRHRLTVHLALAGVPEDRSARCMHIARHFNAELIRHQVDPAVLPPLPTNARIPAAAYFRLLIPRLVGEPAGRILYLDCDLVVAADLGPLWATGLGGAVLAAVRDPDGDRTCRTALGLSVGHRYFNSGVLLIDLQAWRRERVTERSLDFLERFPDRAFHYHDQDALNACLDGRVAYLSPHWNFMPYLKGTREHPENAAIELGRDSPGIVHFAGEQKAWTAAAPDDRWTAIFRAQQEALNSLILPAPGCGSGFPRATAGTSNGGRTPARAAQRFCVMTMGRSASTTLMAALEAESDIALPNKDFYCPGNELLQPVRMSLYRTFYGRRTGRAITTPEDLVDAFYAWNAGANFAGFKSFPSRHRDMAVFGAGNDLRFVALLRRDLPSAVASFMLARSAGAQWARRGGPQALRWRFDPELDAGNVETEVAAVVGECRALLRIPDAVRLTYEQLCDPGFSSAALDALFERPIRIADPRPPTDAAGYVDNWAGFAAFVHATADRIDPRIRIDLDAFAAQR